MPKIWYCQLHVIGKVPKELTTKGYSGLLLLFGGDKKWLKPLKNTDMEHLLSALGGMCWADRLTIPLSEGANVRLLPELLRKGRGGKVCRETDGSTGRPVEGPFPIHLCTKHKAEHGMVYENAEMIRNGK